jgi:hypothetical protein
MIFSCEDNGYAFTHFNAFANDYMKVVGLRAGHEYHYRLVNLFVILADKMEEYDKEAFEKIEEQMNIITEDDFEYETIKKALIKINDIVKEVE